MSLTPRIFETIFPWVKFTPFGKPVVPEVYIMRLKSSLNSVNLARERRGLIREVRCRNLRWFDNVLPTKWES
jgi:hypothetical protein